jgi:hypothetical protein
MINKKLLKQSFLNVKNDINSINNNLSKISISNQIENQNINNWIINLTEKQAKMEQEILFLNERIKYLENSKK